MKKKIIVIILCIILISLCALSFCGCTDEGHIKSVSMKIRWRYIIGKDEITIHDDNLGTDEKVKPTDFEIYPLYNVDEELKWFLVEFQPYGYFYVKIIFDTPVIILPMYRISSSLSTWTPCYIDKEKDSDKNKDLIWELDDNGNKVIYKNSPFFVRGALEEKKYLIKYESTTGPKLIPSIKCGEKYVNLYNNCEFTIKDGKILEKQAAPGQIGFYKSGETDLW